MTPEELEERLRKIEAQLRQVKAQFNSAQLNGVNGGAQPAPVINVHNERQIPTTWEFETDASGKTRARAIQ